METRIRDFYHLHSSERSSSLSPSYGRRTGHSLSPQPFISLFTSQSLSGDLHSTALTDLDKHVLGVCNLPRDNENVASIAMSGREEERSLKTGVTWSENEGEFVQEVVVPQKCHPDEVVDRGSGLEIEGPEKEWKECPFLVKSAAKHGTWRARMKCLYVGHKRYTPILSHACA